MSNGRLDSLRNRANGDYYIAAGSRYLTLLVAATYSYCSFTVMFSDYW